MPEDKSGKPTIKPKPAIFSTHRINVLSVEPHETFSESSDEVPQPMPRKSKLKKITEQVVSQDIAPTLAMQQTSPPEDLNTVLTLSPSKSVISFDDENANLTSCDSSSYSTISRTIEKKVFFRNFSCTTETFKTQEMMKADEIVPFHTAPLSAKLCWKSEEFLAVEPAASIEELESFTSLDDLLSNQQQTKIEKSPERFLDDILRKRRSLKNYCSPVKPRGIEKDIEDIEAAMEAESPTLSNVIPLADEDTKRFSSLKQRTAEYANLAHDNMTPLVHQNTPFYANLQPLHEKARQSMSAEDKDQIRRMNLFFGVKKDTKTDLEMEVFKSIISGNAHTTRVVHAKSVQQQKGRRRLTHLRSNVKDGPTSHASGQLLQDLNRVKKSASDKIPVLYKNNKSLEDLRASPFLSSSSKAFDWSAWKHKFIKVMKRHFTQEEEEESNVVVATFGVPLEMCPMSSNNKNVPAIVEFCITVVEHLGLTSQGIYRIPGNNASVNALLSELNKDPDSITFEHDRWQDVNVIGSILKLFFRKLTEPLVICDIYEEVIQTAKCMHREKKLIRLKLHLLDLPPTNRETFKYLANHLNRVTSNQASNKMDAHNLAIMFGPSLVRPRNESTNQMLSDMKYQTDVVENIIKYSEWMFSDWTDESNVPLDEGDKGYDENTSMNPELLPNAEAILAFKSKEAESPEESGSFSFLRNGFIRLSGRGKTRRKSGKSDGSTGVVSNLEREVPLKTFDVVGSGRAWRSHDSARPVPVRRELKHNLSKKYASKELVISAPLRDPPPPTIQNIDDSTKEENVFSSIKRYPAYSFKNTTIGGKTRNRTKEVPWDKKRNLSEDDRCSSDSGGSTETRDKSNEDFESNTPESALFASSDGWMSKEESFVVRRPGGRSYFASNHAGDKLFNGRSSKVHLSRLQLMQEVNKLSPGDDDDLIFMSKRKQIPYLVTDGCIDEEIPKLCFTS